MRLDKYLKVSRLIKRRTVAKEVADNGRILVNGNIAKSSTALAIGDLVSIRFGNKRIEIEVCALAETVRKEDAQAMYLLRSEEKIEESAL